MRSRIPAAAGAMHIDAIRGGALLYHLTARITTRIVRSWADLRDQTAKRLPEPRQTLPRWFVGIRCRSERFSFDVLSEEGRSS